MDHAAFPFQIKSLAEAGQIAGLAAGYGNEDLDGDVFAPGAFAKSVAALSAGGRQPAMLLHHDAKRPAGRWDSFAERKDGLQAEGALALEASDGREAYALLKAGALTGLSVGFVTRKSQPRPRGRLILEADLIEVSLVATPSNPVTRISNVKSVTDVRELEDLLREAGFSGRRAKAAASAAWKAAGDARDAPISPKIIETLSASAMRLQTKFS